jgi:hypothetical protein
MVKAINEKVGQDRFCMEIIQTLEQFPSKVTSPLATLRVWASNCVTKVFNFTRT